MNERIRELIEQATEKIANDGKDLWLGKTHYRLVFNKEKFAELIVQECISICKEKERPNLYGVREVETTIKEHFGV